MSSDFPLSVRLRKKKFFFQSQQGGRGCVFAVFFAPIPEKGISGFIAHGSIIRVPTVAKTVVTGRQKPSLDYEWGVSTSLVAPLCLRRSV